MSHHEHHHEALSCVEQLGPLDLTFEAHEHEGAVAVSCVLRLKEGCEVPFFALVDALVSAAEALEGAGAFIGHMKALATRGSTTVNASLTDLSQGIIVNGDAALLLTPDSQAQAVAIVVGISLLNAYSLVRSSLTSVLAMV